MTATKPRKKIRCPWKGPKPFEEADAKRFFGRATEVEDLLHFMKGQRLTVLVALSGVGKSSLLQAGLVPTLRQLQEKKMGIGPVLLVREWGDLGTVRPAELLANAVRAEVRRLAERGNNEKQFAKDMFLLGEVDAPVFTDADDHQSAVDKLVEYVSQLCDVVGELVLIVDQAEELLGSGLERLDALRERRVLDVWANLFRQESRCRILLSMRWDFQGRLNPLVREINGLDKRVFSLNPIKRDRLREAILQPIRETNDVECPEEDNVFAEFLKWLGPVNLSGESIVSEQTQTFQHEIEDVDLLRLQALLLDVFRFATSKVRAGSSSERGDVIIDRGVMAEYLSSVRRKVEPRSEMVDLPRLALENYIDELFPENSSESIEGYDYSLLRRIVVRMAPWLSSPRGFKRHIGGEELVFNALREDFQVLRVSSSPEEIRRIIRCFRASEAPNLKYNKSIGREEVSGRARALSLTPPEVGHELLRLAVISLQVLINESVLKKTAGQHSNIYELVHDGFGPALQEWAERHQGGFRDTEASIVSRCGENFRWGLVKPSDQGREPLEIAHQCWLGCNLSGVTFEQVVFRNCDLRGTIFLDCKFDACTFIDCELNGIVLKNCSWNNVKWHGCDGKSTLSMSCIWSDVTFESCVLENMSLFGIRLEGALCFSDSTLRYSQILPLQPKGSITKFTDVIECDLRNALFDSARQARRFERCRDENVEVQPDEADFPKNGRFARLTHSGA